MSTPISYPEAELWYGVWYVDVDEDTSCYAYVGRVVAYHIEYSRIFYHCIDELGYVGP